MRDYGKVYSRFWINPDIAALSISAKLAAVYFLTSQYSNALGCYKVPLPYAAFDLGTTLPDLRHDLAELDRVGFAQYDEEVEFVFISHFLKFNPPENRNQGKALTALFDSVPPSSWIHEGLVEALIDFCARFLPVPFTEKLRNERPGRS